MMKFFVYELKKNVWTLVVLTALATILYVVVQSASDVIWKSPMGQISVETPQIGVVYGELGVLCILVPVLMYSFKMNKRSVDEFYSLPIKREKIYLAKTLAGLILVMVPYAVAYWAGFLSVALRENYYHLGYYAAGYFGGVLFGLCLYGINSFAFARANRITDGIIFIVAYTFIGWLLASVLSEIFPKAQIAADEFIAYSCLWDFGTNIAVLIKNGSLPDLSWGYSRGYDWSVEMFLYPILFAFAAYFLLFFLVRFDKGEDAEQNSDSPFGYRLMIPAYTVLCLFMCGNEFPYICMVVIAAIILTIIHTRKFLFGWRWWAVIAASAVIGITGCYLIEEFIVAPRLQYYQ